MKVEENKITEKVNVWEELSRVKKLEQPVNTLQEVLENIVIERPKKIVSKYSKLIFLHYKNNDLEIIYEIIYCIEYCLFGIHEITFMYTKYML